MRAVTGTRLHAIEGEDVALALFELASGALASLEATTVAWPGYPRRLEISGTEGTLVVEGDRIAAADLEDPAARASSRSPASGRRGASTAVVADATPHRRLFEDFARAIATGATPACDGREGLRSLALVEAVYAAARQRRIGGRMSTRREPALDPPSARDRVVEHVRQLIERGAMRPGDRLPSERDLAAELGVSRPSVRSGLEALEAMGVVVSRRGAGTFIAEGPPDLGIEPLSLLASLHGFTPNEMFEARLVLEVGVAGARRRARHGGAPRGDGRGGDRDVRLARGPRRPSCVHDVRFHRAIAAGCGNRVLAALMEMVSAQFYELRRQTIERARDLRESAEMHRRVYRAIRSHNADAARAEMTEHLRVAQHAQTLEPEAAARADAAEREQPE